MAVTYNKMLLDINEKPSDIITAVQNDTNSRYLDVLLYDNGTPIDLTGCEVKIFMKKPENGGEVWNDGIITDAADGRCEFLLTTEALTHFGHLQVQISIWKDNTEILSSQIFEIIVTKSLLGASSVEASNEYGTMVILFQNLYEAHALMTTMVQNVGAPGELAKQYGLKTMWDAWEYMSDYISVPLTQMISNALANASVSEVLNRLGLTEDTGGSETAGTLMAKANADLKMLGRVNSLSGYYAPDPTKAFQLDFEQSDFSNITLNKYTIKKIAAFKCRKNGVIFASASGKANLVAPGVSGGGTYSFGIFYVVNNVGTIALDVGSVADSGAANGSAIGSVTLGWNAGVTNFSGNKLIKVNAGDVVDIYIRGLENNQNATAPYTELSCAFYAKED